MSCWKIRVIQKQLTMKNGPDFIMLRQGKVFESCLFSTEQMKYSKLYLHKIEITSKSDILDQFQTGQCIVIEEI